MNTQVQAQPSIERMALISGAFAACALASYGVVEQPWLMAGCALGMLLLGLVLTRPVVLLAVLLALGPTDLSSLTGGFKNLFTGLGGLDANGIRLIAVCAGFLLVAATSRKVQAAASGPYGRWYLLFLVLIALTLPLSMAPIDGLKLYLKLWYPFLIFMVTIGLASSREQLEKLLLIALISAAVIALVATPLTLLMGRYIRDPAGYIRISGVIGVGPFSFYLLMAMLMALSRFLIRKSWPYLVLAMLLGFWLVLTHTRITLLAALASLTVITAVEASRRGWRALLGGALLALLIGIPLLPAVLERSLGFVPTTGQLLHMLTDPLALYNSINWQGRQVLWPIVFAAFLSSPIYGLGLGSSTAITRANFPEWAGTVVHNEYLRLATDTGVIGVCLFAIAISVWLVAALRARLTTDPLAHEFALAAIGGIVAWTFISITDNPFDYYAPFTQFIGFTVGGAVACMAFASKS
ncbi:MAG: O-antigen ligase family protein [Gemmatimonadota bacterium]